MCLANSIDMNSISTAFSAPIKKRVTFGGVMGKCEAPQNYRITKNQKALLWYNKIDIDAFRNNLKEILGNGNKIDDTDCFRGIEAYVNRRRSKLNKACVASVLSLQADHVAAGITDATGLKSYASLLSKNAVKLGVLRAATDAMEAYQFYQEASNGKVDFDFKQTLIGFVGAERRPIMAPSA